MNTVQQLLDVSQQLYTHLNHSIEEVDRDEYIETIFQLLDERQSLIDNLSGEYSEEEKELGKQIVQLNQKIDQRLQEKLRFLKQELETFQQNNIQTSTSIFRSMACILTKKNKHSINFTLGMILHV